jgi:hypothetical protein
LGYKIKKNEMGGAYSMYGGGEEMHTGFWWGNVRESNQLEDIGIDGRIKLKWIFKEWDGGVWTGLIRLMIGTGVRLL